MCEEEGKRRKLFGITREIYINYSKIMNVRTCDF